MARSVARGIPGLVVASVIAAVATLSGGAVPLLGAPVIAISIGVVLSGVLGRRAALQSGISFSSKRVLQLAVVVLGSQLSLAQIADVGLSSLPVMLSTLIACLIAAWLFGRLLRIDADLNILIGVGTAICGASAIAAVSPVIKARSHVVAYAVSTIFCFNIAAVVLFPSLGHVLSMSQADFGLFAGTAVNDTSSVVAAATTYGTDAGSQAVVVKLVRTLAIIPICLVLDAWMRRRARRSGANGDAAGIPVVPWFLVAFLLVAGLNSFGFIPEGTHGGLHLASVFLVTVALAAIGLSTDFGALRTAGFKPLLLGGILSCVVTATSLLFLVVL